MPGAQDLVWEKNKWTPKDNAMSANVRDVQGHMRSPRRGCPCKGDSQRQKTLDQGHTCVSLSGIQSTKLIIPCLEQKKVVGMRGGVWKGT